MRRPRALALAVALTLVTSCGGTASGVAVADAPASTTTTGPATTATPTTGSTSSTAGSTTSTTTAPSADGIGDALFPQSGNPGIDIVHYDLDLTYDPPTDRLDGTATLDVRATTALPSFHLDLSGLTVSAVTVDGRAAGYRQVDPELVITPSAALAAGQSFTVVVRYGGVPVPRHASFGDDIGWIHTADQAYVLAEPDGARQWFPGNDHPSDKATFSIELTVPAGVTAVANGRLQGTDTLADGRVRWRWQAHDPMATYLATVALGQFRITEGTGPDGLPLRDALPPSIPDATAQAYLQRTTQMIDFFDDRFGRFPLEAYGILGAESPSGLALETQTLSLFSAADLARGPDAVDPILAHELAHQWFGDAVSPARWQDIWLNESFATYAEWLWGARSDPASLDQRAEAARRQAGALRRRFGPVDRPTEATLFSPNVYDGGAVVLHALRKQVGDPTFFRILQTWVQRHAGGAASTDDFVALSSELAGTDLTGFFRTWLGSTDLPPYPGG
jgi:aminopeptidase N